jgi:hypothetical protein
MKATANMALTMSVMARIAHRKVARPSPRTKNAATSDVTANKPASEVSPCGLNLAPVSAKTNWKEAAAASARTSQSTKPERLCVGVSGVDLHVIARNAILNTGHSCRMIASVGGDPSRYTLTFYFSDTAIFGALAKALH